MTFLLTIIFISFLAEAFFSGAETAFVSVNFLKLMNLIEKKNKRAMLVHNLLKKPDRLLTTTLIGTNVSVVASGACATALFSRFAPDGGEVLATLVLTPLSFIFCQLLTKTVSRYHANRLALLIAAPLMFSEKLFLPLVNFFSFFATSVARLINPGGLKKNPFLTKDEIKSLIKDISREGILEPHEKEAIDKIFDMTVTRAADIMIPLKDVVAVDMSDSIAVIKEKCRASTLTRFPVFDGGTLKGLLNIFDIFYAPPEAVSSTGDFDWHAFIEPISRIEHDESMDKIFSKIQASQEALAAVMQGREVVGILTMEDLMEEITSRLTDAKGVSGRGGHSEKKGMN